MPATVHLPPRRFASSPAGIPAFVLALLLLVPCASHAQAEGDSTKAAPRDSSEAVARQIPAAGDTTAAAAPDVRLTGSATLTGDVYVFSSDPGGVNQPRRPANLWRLILSPTLTFGDWLTIPFNIMIASRETNVTTPATGGSNLIQFLQNPGNNLGLLTISPRIGWAQFHLGTHVPMYSELSSGDGQVFGAGVDLRPGRIRFSMSAGTIQRAIEPDSANNIHGSYARWIYLTKIGYGSEEGTYVDLNFVRAKDDPASVGRRPEDVEPQEGVLMSINTRVRIDETMFVTAEFGTSVFTQNMYASDLENPDPTLNSIIRQRISSRQDFAGTAAFTLSEKAWGGKALVRYIGAGYVALGYPYLQPDRLEFLLSPRVALYDNRLTITGSVGNRTNNLSNTKAATSNQFIGSANVLGIITDELSVALGYSNFGVRNNLADDTLKIETVSQSINISPTWTHPTETVVHSLTATYARDIFDDYNVVSGRGNSNVTQSVTGIYGVSLVRIPLTANILLTHLGNDLPSGALSINSVTLGTGYRFLDGKLSPSLSLTWAENAVDVPGEDRAPDRQIYFRAALRWQLARKLQWQFSASNNAYDYGSSNVRPASSFNELLIQTSLSASL